MTDEEIRIAVAVRLGRKPQTECRECYGTGFGGSELDHEPCFTCKSTGRVAPYVDSPDYHLSLTACHEMEKALIDSDKWWIYCTHLNAIVCEDADEPLNQDPDTLWGMIHATARQRCKAFIRTFSKQEEAQPT